MLVCMEALGDITARIVAKLIADRVEQEKPSAGSRKATSGGSARTGNRMDRRSEYAATMAGEDRSSHPVGENVIDYRDSAPLLAAWGSRLNAPSKGATPNHLKRPASKTCRASRRQHDPR